MSTHQPTHIYQRSRHWGSGDEWEVFSQSNGLVATIRHMSAFHHKQAIILWFVNINNLKTYQNLSILPSTLYNATDHSFIATFLLNNYHQAFKIIKEGTQVLPQLMVDLEISNIWQVVRGGEDIPGGTDEGTRGGDIAGWVLPEATGSLQWVSLPLLFIVHHVLISYRAAFNASEGLFSASGINNMWVVETKCCQLMEADRMDIQFVQVLEAKLNTPCWIADGPECIAAMKLLCMCKYQCSLDHLEGLIVAHIFKLSKANWSQTGKFFIFLSYSMLIMSYRICPSQTHQWCTSKPLLHHPLCLRDLQLSCQSPYSSPDP